MAVPRSYPRLNTTFGGHRYRYRVLPLFFRKASLRLAFLPRVDGLAFFLVLPGLSEVRLLSFASREKEIVEPILRENL